MGHNHGPPSTGIVPVDHSAEGFRADLSLPGAVGSLMARVILDSGSNNIFVRLRVEPHFESDPNIAESGPNIVDVESRVSLRVNLFS